MKLTRYTRRLEECRKRWHRRTAGYVLEVARIVQAARRAARDERRWGRWIREETRKNRTTVYRYLRVAKFLRANVDLKHQLVSMSIAKLYALARLNRDQVSRLVRSGKAEALSDVSFLSLARGLQPQQQPRITRPNLSRSLEASIVRLDRSVRNWQHSGMTMSAALRMKLKSRLHALERALDRIRATSAAAM
jgi:hypothetical protein